MRSTLAYGPMSPQGRRTGDGPHGTAHDEWEFFFAPRFDPMGEDCLRLNIWTPGTRGSALPVLVLLHGGGCSAWSGQFLPSFDGANLARRHGLVVVSVSHRLGPLGFLHLSGLDPALADSGNVGILDLVLALGWVRENIGAFGGDASSVTLFGQSGGGAKISALLGLPQARGLFHRAINSGGFSPSAKSAEHAEQLAREILVQLGLSPKDAQRLADVPAVQLVTAGAAALQRLASPDERDHLFRAWARPRRHGWGPVLGVAGHPTTQFGLSPPSEYSTVPLMLGTVSHEVALDFFSEQNEALEERALEQGLDATFPSRGRRIADAARALAPEARPIELLALVRSANARRNASAWAARQHRAQAPAYMYWFDWRTPVLEGRPRSVHCLDLPFVSDTTDLCATMTGGGEEPARLADQISTAIAAFARSGSPEHRGLPPWGLHEPGAPRVMRWAQESSVIMDPDRELREVIAAALPAAI